METVKGFRDIEGEEAEKASYVRKIISEEFERYGFEYSETPIVEYEEFVRGENSGDEAVSDIFKLADKGQRKLALRYEFTFQLKRLSLNKKLPYKRYQIGPVFRDEPVSANRFRQFTQCDADVIGSSVLDEAELLRMARDIFSKLEIKPKIYVNSRRLLNEILSFYDVRDVSQVLREIDKLDKLPEKEVKEKLKKLRADKIVDILKNKEKYFEKFESYNEIVELKKYCKLYGVDVEFKPSLVRGLSYYNGTIFEIKSGIKETICSGGSYLVNNIQSTGISFGVDRIVADTKVRPGRNKVLVISIAHDKEAIALVSKLRESGLNCVLLSGKISKALEYANSKNISYVVFVGDDEVKKRKYTLKNLKSGKEKKLSESEIVKNLKES